jgi:hypothetical protein
MLAVFLLTSCAALPFSGPFFEGDGPGDAGEWVSLLNTARAQFSPSPTLQDVSWLYTPSWNGFVEGPTWGAWWTQNSYGTTLAAAPWLDEPLRSFTYNANWWWFQFEGDGKRVGLDDPHPAPDGCLCDAASPKGAYYKQGDGNVPIHDWALEETLSAVIMQAELLLVDRSAAQTAPFIPLFNRTLNLIESRRDAATGLLFAGTSSNLLAPSYGAWLLPNGTRAPAFLAGMCVSYVAALDRVIELEELTGYPELAAAHRARRAATLAALPQLLAPTRDYFVKWADPNGTLHGVLGAPRHSYIEAVVNHDAVALGVAERVAPGLSERIMGALLGAGVPPNPATGAPGLRPFNLVVTNAGGLDDMENGDADWLWSFGTWVNGGEWATCEARMMLAYAATGRSRFSLDSMRALMGFANIFRMDSPLVKWGSEVYQPNEPINTVFDMWACVFAAAVSKGGIYSPTNRTYTPYPNRIPAALLRGLWLPAYALDTLTLTPSLPGNVTALRQLFPLLWGGKRLLLSASGNTTRGIVSVVVNGAPWPASLFTLATITLPWAALAGGDNFTVDVSYPPAEVGRASGQGAARGGAAAVRATSVRALRGLIPFDAALWLDAHSLAFLPDGGLVATWPDARGAGTGPVAAQPLPAARPTFRAAAMAGWPGVDFNGASTFLGGNVTLPATSTTFAVLLDRGTLNVCCTGVFFSKPGCNGLGTKAGPANSTVLMIDFSGSPDTGLDDLRGRVTVAAVVYNASGAYSFADGCLESTEPPVGAAGSTFQVGTRGNEMGRFFNGVLSELIVFPRSLNDSEFASVSAYLHTKWPAPASQPRLNCGGPPANCTLPAPAAGAFARCARFAAGMRAAGFPDARYELAHALLVGDSATAWAARCGGLNNGTIAPLANRNSEEAANQGYLDTPTKLAGGLGALLDSYKGSADADKAKIYGVWEAAV